MNGWIVFLGLAGAVLLGMWPWLRRDMGALQFVGAALLLALTGYTLQGEQRMAGAPKAEAGSRDRPDTEFAQLRREVFPLFDRAGQVLGLAEAQARMGYSEQAVGMLRSELDKSPRDMVLWLGLADVLITHGEGMVTPSALLAFDRAAQVAPNHPGPTFFYALAMARMGQFDQAEAYFERVLQMPETTERWRELVTRARAGISQLRTGMPPGPPPPS